MPRIARKICENGIYHIIMRGINRQTIFFDEKDFNKFIQTLVQYKEKSGYTIYAYCLMGNHIHMLVKVGIEPLDQIMRRICGSFVYWYNLKYSRIGNLFQDRFKSEPVENDSYFITVLRYIHQNPVIAGIVAKVEDYRWSSYSEYLSRPRIIEPSFGLSIFNINMDKALEQFIRHSHEKVNDSCLEVYSNGRITDDEAIKIIVHTYQIQNVTELQELGKPRRNAILKELVHKYGLSVRQLERITGINRGTIMRV